MPINPELTKFKGQTRLGQIVDYDIIDATTQEGEAIKKIAIVFRPLYAPDKTFPIHCSLSDSRKSKWAYHVNSVRKAGYDVVAGPDYIGGKWVKMEDVEHSLGKDITFDAPEVVEVYADEAACRAANPRKGDDVAVDPTLEEAIKTFKSVGGDQALFVTVWGALHPGSDAAGAFTFAQQAQQ